MVVNNNNNNNNNNLLTSVTSAVADASNARCWLVLSTISTRPVPPTAIITFAVPGSQPITVQEPSFGTMFRRNVELELMYELRLEKARQHVQSSLPSSKDQERTAQVLSILILRP